jgi:hypothetical protein
VKRRDEQKRPPVGLYSLKGDSPYGYSDMSGNVWVSSDFATVFKAPGVMLEVRFVTSI